MQARRLLYIDALRGFAILGVIVVHVAGAFPAPSHVLNVILANGGRGVQLFFVVSAFTLFHSLDSKTAGAAGLFRFFVRRYFRVAPLYYAGCCSTSSYISLTRGIGLLKPSLPDRSR